MAMRCENCGKGPSVGHTISHSNIKTLRRYLPNLLRKRFQTEEGVVVYVKICTACLRTMVKPPRTRLNKKARTTSRPPVAPKKAPKTKKAKVVA